nr:unnamed protein product [Callosobruchus analis]
MERSIRNMYRDRCPDLTEGDHEFDILEETIKLRSIAGDAYNNRKIVKISHDGTDQDLWQKINRLKGESEGTERLALHHITHDILTKIAKDEDIDIIIGQEPNKNRTHRLFCDENNDAFIQTKPDISVLSHTSMIGIVGIETPDLIMYSCYLPPSRSCDEFGDFLHKFGRQLKRNHKEMIIAGDLNAKSTVFGSPVENTKGKILEEW